MIKKEDEIIKESIPKGHCRPIGKSEILNLMDIGENSMVKIFSNKCNGSGFLCKIKDEKLGFEYALFTNNHVLDEEELKVGEKISFDYKNKSRYIKLDKNRKIFTDKKIDYTCIEIRENDNFDDFFLIDDQIMQGNLNYKDEDIIILQFPGNEISFSQGKLKNIEEDSIYYTASTEIGSSGSPLIIRKNIQKYYVLGLHYGTKMDFNVGRPMKYIFDDITIKIELNINHKREEIIKKENKIKYKNNIKYEKNIKQKFNTMNYDNKIKYKNNVIYENNIKDENIIKENKNKENNEENNEINNDITDFQEKEKFNKELKNLKDFQVYKGQENYYDYEKTFNIYFLLKLESLSFLEIYFDEEPHLYTDNFFLSFKFKEIKFAIIFRPGSMHDANGFTIVMEKSPITIIDFPIDGDLDELSHIIYQARGKIGKESIEIILIWNSYKINQEKRIPKEKKKNFEKNLGIKYSFEISTKEDVEIILKNIGYITYRVYQFQINRKDIEIEKQKSKGNKEMTIKREKEKNNYYCYLI